MSKKRIKNLNGVVDDCKEYLKNRGVEESLLSEEKRVVIDNTGKSICNDYEDHENCTLVGITNILMNYRRGREYDIPVNYQDIYKLVHEEAVKLKFRPETKKGLPVTKNGVLLRHVLKRIGILTKAFATIFFTKRAAIAEIDNGRPFLLSLANGVYYNHTVTVKGYTVMRSTSGKQYTFLILSDAWSREVRYLPWSGCGAFYIACMTRAYL